MAAKKMNKVTQARKAFVQARVQATGKTTKEARAQFRQRFDKLASSSTGRQTIAKVTGQKGIRKELAASYTPKSTSVTKANKKISGVGVASTPRKSEAQSEAAMRARGVSNRSARDAKAYRPSASKKSGYVDGRDGNRNTKAGVGLIAAAGAGAAALGVRGAAAKGARMDAAQRASLARPAAEYEAMFGKRPSAMTPRSFGGNVRGGFGAMFGRAGGGLRSHGR
jgi:hypothetical protein